MPTGFETQNSRGLSFLTLLEGADPINQQDVLVATMSSLYLNSINSDVTFEVDDGRQFKAHRAILAAHSPVLATMLLDKAFKESRGEVVKLPGKTSTGFDAFLKYLYTGAMDVRQLDLDTAIDVLLMAHEYQAAKLVEALSASLMTAISIETVFKIYEPALLLEDTKLLDACRQYLFENADEVLKNPEFCDLSKGALVDIISEDWFFAPENDILYAVNYWHEQNYSADIKDVLAKIRFAYVNIDRPSASILDMLMANDFDLKRPYRNTKPAFPRKEKFPLTETNIATLENGTVITGPTGSYVDCILRPSTSQRVGYMSMNTAITVDLSRLYQVASMAFVIYATTSQSMPTYCSYLVETSRDLRKWSLLADCRDIDCYDKQLLMFDARKMRYVKITGLPAPAYPSERYYGVLGFQCPSEEVTVEDKGIYSRLCPTGGICLHQINCNSSHQL